MKKMMRKLFAGGLGLVVACNLGSNVIAISPTTNVITQEVNDENERMPRVQMHEYLPNLVIGFYKNALNRNGSDSEVMDWAYSLAYNYPRSVTGSQMGLTFFTCPEYLARKTNNSVFVQNLYGAFFRRSADASGQTYWMNQLSKGMSRNEIIRFFANSAEYGDWCSYYEIYQGRV